MVRQALARGGYTVFPPEPAVARWAKAARRAGLDVLARGGERRHGQTWFVGVDALPNASDGSVDGVPLAGTWLEHVETPQEWHQAQLSVVFPDTPGRTPEKVSPRTGSAAIGMPRMWMG